MVTQGKKIIFFRLPDVDAQNIACLWALAPLAGPQPLDLSVGRGVIALKFSSQLPLFRMTPEKGAAYGARDDVVGASVANRIANLITPAADNIPGGAVHDGAVEQER